MSEAGSTVHIGKLAAAQRQLDAAIRMTFAGEDVLAIHTVAAAAHRLLRDIKEKRGHKALAEQWRDTVLALGRDFAKGEMSESDIKLFEQSKFWGVIARAAQMIKSVGTDKKISELRSLLHVHVSVETEKWHWGRFNRAANFLKHARDDHQASLAIDELNTDLVIMEACEAYLDLMGRHLTPEMEVWWASEFYLKYDLAPPKGGPFRILVDHLRRIKPQERNKACAKLVLNLKLLKRVTCGGVATRAWISGNGGRR